MRKLLLALLMAFWAFLGISGQAWAQGGQISPCPLVTHLKLIPDASYTVSTTDYCWWIVFTNTGPISVKLPAPGLIFPPMFSTTFLSLSGGTVSLTGLQDDAGKIHKINNVTTLTLSAGQGAELKVQEDYNWWAFTTGGSGGGGGGCTGFGCLIPLGFGFSKTPGVDNQGPLTIGVDTLYGQTFDTDTSAASYTFGTSDVSHLKTFSSSSYQTATLPAAGTAGFEKGSIVCFLVTGTGGMTLGAASGSLVGVPLSGGLASFAQSGNGCAESAPPNWTVSAVVTPVLDGQVMIGSSVGFPLPATLTAGSGITITNGHNSIAISATGSGGTLTSVSATTSPCLTASPAPITGVGTIALQSPLSVACGGTGDSSLTPYSVLLAGTTSTAPVAFATTGTSGRYLRDNGASSNPSMTAIPCGDLPGSGCPSEIAMFWAGVPPSSQIVNIDQAIAKVCVAGFTGTSAHARTASTGTAVVNVNQITSGVNTNRGSVTFTASATGVTASSLGMTINPLDIVQFAFPASADATLADVSITLLCKRT